VFDSAVRKNGELHFVGLDRTPALAGGARETCTNAGHIPRFYFNFYPAFA
jgi:hypothetical protein